ncbi:predicted protein [Plenodomus lingam JN3]|uniref:Predicted protein n=1 Tax=Leptosphaeria maculans (strain JN3 / isolate v23.1.3 / race Av1-4-5-6-7-8) TaxID=985895 RepID=E4ZXA4_LEPMJ|nr:predicted protein [Plenodomus lingam JN3]CBX95314.1 predicted protein [Plenodomus lingam JN3]
MSVYRKLLIIDEVTRPVCLLIGLRARLFSQSQVPRRTGLPPKSPRLITPLVDDETICMAIVRGPPKKHCRFGRSLSLAVGDGWVLYVFGPYEAESLLVLWLAG